MSETDFLKARASVVRLPVHCGELCETGGDTLVVIGPHAFNLGAASREKHQAAIELLAEEIVRRWNAAPIPASLMDDLTQALDEADKDLVCYQVNARTAAGYDDRWDGVAERVQPTINRIRTALSDLDAARGEAPAPEGEGGE